MSTIAEVLEKKAALQSKKIALGLAGAASLGGNAAFAQTNPSRNEGTTQIVTTVNQPTTSDRSEIKLEDAYSSANQRNYPIRVYKRVNHLRFNDMIPNRGDRFYDAGREDYDPKYQHKAYYDDDLKAAIIECFEMDEADIYRRANIDFIEQGRACPNLEKALSSFNATISSLKTENKKPYEKRAESLQDVKDIMQDAHVFKAKEAQKLYAAYSNLRLDMAIDLQNYIENKNNENLSIKTVGHEIDHGDTQETMDKTDLPTYLVTPQDQFLLDITNEMRSFVDNQYKGLPVNEALDKFVKEHGDFYDDFYKKERDNYYHKNETYRTKMDQYLDIEYQDATEDLGKMRMETDWQNEEGRYTENNTTHYMQKIWTEDGKSFSYCQYDDEKRSIPEGSMVVTPKGKKFEVDILYDAKTGKPRLDETGNKIRVKLHEDYNYDQHMYRLTKEPVVKGDSFRQTSKEHLFVLVDEIVDKMYKNKDASAEEIQKTKDAFKTTLKQFESKSGYKHMSNIYAGIVARRDVLTVAMNKESPMTDERAKQLSAWNEKSSAQRKEEKLKGLIEITDQYQGLLQEKFGYQKNPKIQKEVSQMQAQAMSAPRTQSQKYSLAHHNNIIQQRLRLHSGRRG